MLSFLGSERGIKNLTPITWKNIVSDYGATSGGSGTAAGDYTAFKAFRDWAVEETDWVGLVLPPTPGSYYGTQGSYAAAGGGGWPLAISNTPFFGIPKLIVMGYGASMNGLSASAVPNGNTHRADIASVSAGSYSVTLLDVDDAALFSVGAMVLLAGLDLQGFGYPPNSHFNEWHRIAAINGAIVTFDRAIRYSYDANWPRYDAGSAFELGGIGAPAIVRTLPAWDCEHLIYGLTSYNPGGQTYYFVRKSYLFDCKSDDNGFILGASEDMKIVNMDHTASNMEVDKLTTKALIGEYGPSNRSIQIQSSSVDELIIRGGTRTISGTARHTIIDGATAPEIRLGPLAYGISDEITIRDSAVTAFTESDIYHLLDASLTYEGSGVFRHVGASPSQFLVPNAVCYLRTGSPFYNHSPFRVLSVASDGGGNDADALITTSLVGGTLPAISGIANARVYRHSAPDLTVENCTGSEAAVELSLAGANQPYGTFSKRTYTGTPYAVNGVTAGVLFGRLVHLKINVTQAYTGAAGTLTIKLTQFGYGVINGDMTVTTSHIRVNCKVAGERVITAGGVTGEQAGDVGLSDLTGGVWMPRSIGAFFGAGTNGSTAVDVSAEAEGVRPIVTIECLTDQEF